MAPTTLLLTGSTGFIGGTVLNELLASTNAAIKSLTTISLLVRGEDRAQELSKLDPRIKTILYEDLSDHEILSKAASEHDVVIHTMVGFDVPSAHALLDGLANRKRSALPAVYIHTTGASNLSDNYLTKGYSHEFGAMSGAPYIPPIYTDALTSNYTESIPSIIHKLQAGSSYAQRTNDIFVQTLGQAHGIPTYLVMPPHIIGQGTGLYNKGSVAVPSIVRGSLKAGYVPYLEGAGNCHWSAIHIQDLGRAYVTIASAILEDREEVTGKGKDGYFFVESFTLRMAGLAGELAEILLAKGRDVKGAKGVDVETAADLLAYGMKQFVEGSFGCNSLQKAQRLRGLGWEPEFVGREVWKKTLEGDVDVVLGGQEDHAIIGLLKLIS